MSVIGLKMWYHPPSFYLAIQRSVWRDIKFAFDFLFARLRISQRRMVRSA